MTEPPPNDSQGKMVVFGAKQIRRVWHEEQWFFSVVDIIAALTDSDNPRNYWGMMKAREKKQSGVQLSTLCVQLKLTYADGKNYKTDAVNVEDAFRVIQSIPSPKHILPCRKEPLIGPPRADSQAYRPQASWAAAFIG